MSKKRILQSMIDIGMAVLLPLLMARHLTGEAAHEWMGAAMICLFLFHQILNYRWYRALFHERYHAVRVLNTIVNFLLLADILLMGISGIMMSAHVFSFLNVSKGTSAARLIHLPGAFWGFLLMSFHIGLHWQAVLSRVRALWHGKKATAKWMRPMRVLLFLVSAYGVFAFFRRRFPDYLFFKTQFVFLEHEEALVLYLFDMIAILTLFSALGCYCVKLLTKVSSPSRRSGPDPI